MKPILTIVGPEASDIHTILTHPGGGNFTITKNYNEDGECLEIMDAIGEIHEVPTDNITVYVHDGNYYGFEHNEVILEENVDIYDLEFIEKNSEGEAELVLGIE